MNKLATWFGENKGPSVFTAAFLLLAVLGGGFAYNSWDDCSAAAQAYSDATAKLLRMSKQSPPPNDANLAQLTRVIESEQSALNDLRTSLSQYRIPAFSSLDKVKPQDASQLFQDALRVQVTKLKAQSASVGSTLPSGFYLALEEFENRLPPPEDVVALSKQLTVFNWISERLITHPGLIIAEFSKISPTPTQSLKTDRKLPAQNSISKAPAPYENPVSLKLSLRCDQGSLRELLNSLSRSPYFLVIDQLQLQNTVTEPPRRDSAPQNPPPQTAPPSSESQSSVQRIPIIVGREQINASLRIRILEFPDYTQNGLPATK